MAGKAKCIINQEEFTTQVKDGWEIIKQAKYWGCSKRTIARRRNEWQLTQHEGNQRDFQNRNIFKVIDTEEKAYWLGFLYADGNVSTKTHEITLALQAKDYGHIVKFKDFIGLNNKIVYNTKTISYKYRFSDEVMKEDLIKLGCFPNKSLKIKFPTSNQVPDILLHHFLRGYIDGDGTIVNSKTYSIGFIATEDFIKNTIKLFNLPNNKLFNKSESGIVKSYHTSKKTALLFLIGLLYEDASIYLDRKYEKAIALKERLLKKNY